MKRFNEFAEEQAIEGDKIRIDDVLNKELVIHDFRISESKYNKGNGKYVQIQIEKENKKMVIFTGSIVLMNQLEKYKEELPFLVTVKKIDKYYTLT